MPNTCCSAYKCHERGGHKFPNDVTAKNAWIAAVKRKNFVPTPNSVLCRKHFKGSDYITETTCGKYPDRMLAYH